MDTTQLLNTEASRSTSDRRLCVQEKVARHAAEKGLLLMRVKDLPTSGGILRERQKQWMNTAPYDSKTENPVLYRHVVNASKLPSHIAETDEARLEVQSLGDRPATSLPSGSGVTERILQSRKERHHKTVEDMKQELAMISAELEPKIQTASELVKTQLAENDKVIETLLERVSSPQSLQGFTSLEHLHTLWEEVAKQSAIRQQYIRDLDNTLDAMEVERCRMVTDVLHHYSQLLLATAYLLPPDVHRFVEEETQRVNLAILANRRSYIQLCSHLMTADLMREREHRQRWEAAVVEWRDLTCNLTLEKFSSYMVSGAVLSPPDLEKLRTFLVAEQASLTKRREELLQKLGSLRPPGASKVAMYEWNESAEKLHQQLDHVHGSYLLQLQDCHEAVSRACEEEMDRCREHLVSTGAFSSSNVYEVMTEHFLPLVEQHVSKCRQELQNTEKSLEASMISQRAQFHALFQYAQGPAHLWDSHTSALAEMEKTFQEGLEKCRSEHDIVNQNMEANLDVILDRLRQGASEEALKQYLKEALRMLDTIKEGYSSFHSHMVSEVQKFPSLMMQELDTYDSALCICFSVNRQPSKKKMRDNLSRPPSELPPPQSRADSRRAGHRQKTKLGRAKATSSRASSVMSELGRLSTIVEEVIATSQGTSFYVQTKSGEGAGPGTFLTQDEESEEAAVVYATENITISEQSFTKARNNLRASFLDHLEQWRSEMIQTAEEMVEGKVEEAHTELDLRLHLHEPRPSRVEQDIHNIRAAELLAHRERVTRHAQGVVTSLNEQKSLVQTLAEKLGTQAEKFSEEMNSLVSSLGAASNINRLLKVQTQAKQLLKNHLQSIKTVIKTVGGSHLNSAEEVITSLATSNNNFRESLKLFSEGGNYCPEEVEVYSKRMDKLTAKVATAQSFISGEVEEVMKARISSAEAVLSSFEVQFKLHLNDLSFLERVARTFTSTQVLIKSEVAASNTQAREVFDSLEELRRKVDACANPSPDKEEVEAASILEDLPSLFEALSSRMEYLYCKAGVCHGARHTETLTPVAPTRGQGPISAVNITKSIAEHTSVRKKFGAEAEMVGGRQSRAVAQATGVMSSLASADTRRHTQPMRLRTPPINLIPRLLCAHTQEPGNEANIGSTAAVGSVAEDHQRKPGKQTRKKQPAIERKNISFGTGGGKDGTSSFLPKIRAILKETHLELYNMTESFYKQKGPARIPTRPDEIPETFESCMDSFIERCHAYRIQAEEYRSDCIEEFNSQLDMLMSLLVMVPPLVFNGVRLQHRDQAGRAREEQRNQHREEMEKSSREKLSHESSLRPSLGHPSQREQLKQLCAEEERRHETTIQRIETHTQDMKESECAHVKAFVQELLETTQSLLSLFDSVICTSEVIPGSGKQKVKPSAEQLLREHVKPEWTDKAEAPPQTTTVPWKRTWPGLPEAELKLIWESAILHHTAREEQTNKSKTKMAVSSSRKKLASQAGRREECGMTPPTEVACSRKQSAAHEAVIKSRDKAFQEYVSSYHAELALISQRWEERRGEERWYDNWRTAVQKVKELYR